MTFVYDLFSPKWLSLLIIWERKYLSNTIKDIENLVATAERSFFFLYGCLKHTQKHNDNYRLNCIFTRTNLIYIRSYIHVLSFESFHNININILLVFL